MHDDASTNPTILRVDDVEVMYDRSILALHGVSLEVERGSIVALLGANGAGKTTTLMAISRLCPLKLGEVTRGRITYRRDDITRADPADLVASGLVQVLEGRHCFPHLTVEQNLVMGSVCHGLSRRVLRDKLDWVLSAFPRLRERRTSLAGYTSGGEQQMLAIGRALMTGPDLVLRDEPSMGLAPRVIEEIFEIVAELNRSSGVSFLIAEQNAALALDYAHRAYVLENGKVALQGAAAELRTRDDVQAYYLGGSAPGADGAPRSAAALGPGSARHAEPV
jgi:branched-chain amino acid transport system ATP-binding protein